VAGLRDISDATFSWHRVKGVKHAIELHAGDQAFGTLRFDGAEAEVEGQRWAFTRHKKQVIIRDAHGTVAGTFMAAKCGEGQLELADGQRFWWRPTHPGHAERGFYDADGARVVRFWKATGCYRSRTAVRPTRAGRHCRSSLSWLCSAGSSVSARTRLRRLSPGSSPPHLDNLVPTTPGAKQSTESRRVSLGLGDASGARSCQYGWNALCRFP